jgi:hypothetical protein
VVHIEIAYKRIVLYFISKKSLGGSKMRKYGDKILIIITLAISAMVKQEEDERL